VKKSWVPPVLLLLVAAALALLFQDVLREFIVVPILYAYWFARLYVESVPQSFLWAFFLAAAVLLVARSFWSQSIKPRRTRREIPLKPPGKIEAWVERIRLARHSEYFRARLARRLADLLLQTLAYRTRLSAEEVRQQLHQQLQMSNQIPQEIQTYLRAAFATDEESLPENHERIVQFVEEQLGRSPQSRPRVHER
jgi:signal transduction histidine kinase